MRERREGRGEMGNDRGEGGGDRGEEREGMRDRDRR